MLLRPYDFHGAKCIKRLCSKSGCLLLPWPYKWSNPSSKKKKKKSSMKGGRESTDKVWRGAGEAEDKTWWERRLKQMWGVLKSETRQLDADSKWDTGQHFTVFKNKSKPHTLVAGRFSKRTCSKGVMCTDWSKMRRQTVRTVWRHMAQVNNWIIKASLTKACAPPPGWKEMSKVCDLFHLCALIPLVGVGLPPQSPLPSAVIS